jgi:hypothetical protein
MPELSKAVDDADALTPSGLLHYNSGHDQTNPWKYNLITHQRRV